MHTDNIFAMSLPCSYYVFSVLSTFMHAALHPVLPTTLLHPHHHHAKWGTVKRVLRGHSKRRPKNCFQDWLSLNACQKYMCCRKGSILQYFWPSFSYNLSLRSLFCLFLSGRLTLKAPDHDCSRQQILLHLSKFSKEIRYDISWESSASRRLSWNIMPYLLFLKKRQNLKLSSAASYRWVYGLSFTVHFFYYIISAFLLILGTVWSGLVVIKLISCSTQLCHDYKC